ncbi:major facilitator superfamily domain-containing protein [Boeremia exigua]|uniref:major facilitator superfamily domain-containing protein n=1 Tax=Boeremia exigua TaxID=749465 RepID=UPI001E8E465B|nr:major facilitator superfamily domain-containing protein [Boeremia exigua]KAH6642366.1 major facilitator superfamily domain-containing protein [Boeremia exigua]
MANSTPNPNRLSRAAQWLVRELGLHTMRHAGRDVYILILTRYLRMYAYGTVALILAVYLRAQGLSDAQIGFFMTLTLLGDVVVSLLLTLVADALGRRRTLMLGALGMAVSGGVFALESRYEVLLAAAVVGVISPSGNEIGPFRAVEESTLAQLVGEEGRADVFTWYVAFAVLGTSTGLIVGGQAIDALSARQGWTELDAYRAVFWIYTIVGLTKAVCTLFLSQDCEHQKRSKPASGEGETEPLLPSQDNNTLSTSTGNGFTQDPETKAKKTRWNPFTSISPKSRAILFKLCSLFFLDSLGSGMVPFSLINYYLDRKFQLPKGKLGGIMSATWFLSTLSNVFSASVSRRLGLIPAMVCTHLPSSLFLGALPFAPTLGLTILLLIGRSMMSSMDQAPRSAFLSMVVLPEERTAVMGIVNIAKTLSQSAGPWVTGVLAGKGRFWVAFVAAGALKATYDVLLLTMFGGRVHARKAEHEDAVDPARSGGDSAEVSVDSSTEHVDGERQSVR